VRSVLRGHGPLQLVDQLLQGDGPGDGVPLPGLQHRVVLGLQAEVGEESSSGSGGGALTSTSDFMRSKMEAYSSVLAGARRSTFSLSTIFARNLSVTSMMSMFQGSISCARAISSSISMDSSWCCAGAQSARSFTPVMLEMLFSCMAMPMVRFADSIMGFPQGDHDELGVLR